MRLQGKIAVITGAGRGIGRVAAELLASEGATVLATDRDGEAAQGTAAILAGKGYRTAAMQHDVTIEDDWIAVFRRVKDEFGGCHILVNNAGICFQTNLEETTLDQWRQLMSVNAEGVFLGTKQAILTMKGQARCSIVNMSSTAALVGDANLAAYDASKGAVRIFTKAAALHCTKYKYDIRVNSIHPAYVWTPMVEDFLESTGDKVGGKIFADSLHPIGHMGEAIDVAYAILYLASDESKFSTGSELVLDGGYCAQ